MARDGDLGNYLRFNFENAVEMIDKLTKDNNSLLDKIEELENKLHSKTNSSVLIKGSISGANVGSASSEVKLKLLNFLTQVTPS